MIQVDTYTKDGRTFTFIKVEMGKAPFLLLKGKSGYVMCGYMNLEAATKLGDRGVRVSGVSDLDSILESRVAGCTPEASQAGISEGQKVSDILHLL